jgi:hypothetical protein
MEISHPHPLFSKSLNWIWRFVAIALLGTAIVYAAVQFAAFLRNSNSETPKETSPSQGQTPQIPKPPGASNAAIPYPGERSDNASLQSSNTEMPPQSAPPTKESKLVVLEVFGTSSVIQPPRGFPANQMLREQRYLLKNLSSQDILSYSIAYLNERNEIVAEMGRASYPPDQAPVLTAGADETITRRFVGNTDTSRIQAQIDSVVFADGSTYGPDRLKKKAAYTATVETLYLDAQHILALLDTQGPEAVREFLKRRLSAPNAVMPMSVVNAVKASQNKGTVKK